MPQVFSKPVDKVLEESDRKRARRLEHKPPPVPLREVELPKPAKDEFVKVAILSNPDDPDSEKNYINVRYFKDGSPEDWIHLQENLVTMFAGQGVGTWQGKFTIARQHLQGDALRVFNATAATCLDVDDNPQVDRESFNKSIAAVSRHVFPRNALATQKRWMRKWMRKPLTMTVRQYIARVLEMVQQFKYYPDYKPEFAVTEDEVADIVVSSCPHDWERAMILQGFDVVAQPIDRIIEFFERLETTEQMSEQAHRGSKAKRSRNGTSTTGGAEQPKARNGRVFKTNTRKRLRHSWCHLHATEEHDFSECKKMIEQAKKMRGQWLAQAPASQSQTRDRSRGWNKYNRSELPKNKEELNSLVEARVKKAVSKAMQTAGKKKPRETEETDYENELSFKQLKVSDSDSDSE